MLYWLLRAIARIALRWYYREIQVIGAERIPAAGPAILAANHNNALVDAMLVGTAVKRQVRLTAKATLLEHPLTRWIVRGVGIVPLRRTSDEQQRAPSSDSASPNAPLDAARNADAFTTILDTLEEGGMVLIFPEGKSHSEPALAPLKTGCARIALQARDTRRVHDMPIVPVGLTFERKWAPRSRVLLHVGEPIFADDIASETPSAVSLLTARIDAALRAVTLNFASAGDAERVLSVSALLAGVLDQVRPLHAPDVPLATAATIARRLEEVRQRLPHLPAETLATVDAFLTDLDAFRDRLEAEQIPVNDLTMPVSTGAGLWFAIREVAITIVTLPIAVWGRANHWLPVTLARHVGRATSRNPDEPAMHTLVSGLVLVLAFYAVVAAAIWWKAGGWWALGYLATLPPTASLDFWFSDRADRAVRRARAYLRLRADAAMRRELLDALQSLRTTAMRLDAALR